MNEQKTAGWRFAWRLLGALSRGQRRASLGVRVIAGALACAAAVTALSACGGGNGDGDSSAPASATSSDKTSSSSSGASADADGKRLTINMITSIPASDPFYAVVAKAGQVAARDLGVTVKYVSPSAYTTTPAQMARLIDNAVAAKPDGIVMTLPFPTLVRNVKAAVEAGIPTAIFNAGQELLDQTGALAYFGEASLAEGLDMGRRLKAAGVTHVLCPGLARGTVKSLDDRCDGLAQGLKPGKMSTIVIDPGDPTALRNRVQAAVQKDPSIDGVISLGASVSAPTIAAKKALGARGEKIKWASFDLGVPTLKGIIEGDYLFAEDQQQFLQAYQAVVTVVLNKRYGLAPGTKIVSTSAPVVGQDQARAILELAKQELR